MKNLIAFILLCNLFYSCDFVLGPNSSEKFYCKVSGKRIRPEKNTTADLSSDSFQTDYRLADSSFTVRVRNKPYHFFFVLNTEENNVKLGKYYFNKNLSSKNSDNPRVFFDYHNNGSNLEILDGFIEITKKKNYWMYSKFEFTAYDPIYKNNINVTDGQINIIQKK
jgi:hypothetical protein